MDLRLLTEADADSSTTMSHHAFGHPAGDAVAFTMNPQVRRWGIFDGDTLVAKANDRVFESWIGGRRIPTAGVAGVAVVPEMRGRGLARRVMTHLLAAARDRGAVIATLFRTAPALYRSLGFEQVAELVHGSFPTAALRGMRPAHTTLRRAGVVDAAAVREIYTTVAATGSCLLTRDGPAFPEADEELVRSADAFTLAVDEHGGTVGYVSWNRGHGYGGEATLSVVDLFAVTGDAHRALLSAVGSFDAVTPTVRMRTSGADPVHWSIPGAGWTVTEVQPYMLRVIDLVGALTARGWPTGLTAEITLQIDDPVCPWNTGRHRLTIGAGEARVGTPDAGAVATAVTPPGLALLFAGGVPAGALRRAGLISGGSASSDVDLDAAFAGPRPAIADYF